MRSLRFLAQGTGFSEVVAGLESELRGVRAQNHSLSEDSRGCYAQIRAKDRQLAVYELQMAEARRIAVENGVRACRGPFWRGHFWLPAQLGMPWHQRLPLHGGAACGLQQ